MNARKDGKPQNRPRKYNYGVTWRDRKKPWIVKFKRNKKYIHVGTYSTLNEAYKAAEDYLDQES
jgi:AP2 domain